MSKDILTAFLLDEESFLTLGELSRACMVHAEWIIELVDEGVLEPSGCDAVHWRFSGPLSASGAYRQAVSSRISELILLVPRWCWI